MDQSRVEHVEHHELRGPDEGDRDWHRLHPSSLFFGIGGLARRFLIPALFIAAAILVGSADDESRWELWLTLLFVPALIATLLRYFTLRYRFADDEMVIRRGLFVRNERHIPYKKIQNIDLVQGPLHRVVNVAKVKIDTASGAEAEAELNVLAVDAVEEMRRRVFAEKGRLESEQIGEPSGDRAEIEDAPAPGATGAAPRVAAETVTILRLPLIELLKLGAITWRGVVLVAILIGVAFEMGNRFNILERLDLKHRIEDWAEHGFGLGMESWYLTMLLLLPIALLLLLGLSMLWSAIRFYDFTLERAGDDLRIRCGLLTRIAATVPRNRIQFISVRETILHRPFKRVSVRIETAGGKGGDEQHDSISERWIVPLLPRDELPRVLNELRPGLQIDDLDWQGLGDRATGRMARKAALFGIIIGAAGLLLSWPWGALAIVPIAGLLVYFAVRESRYMACALTDLGVVFRSGVWTRKISAAPYEKLQIVSLGSNPFDRRYGHASLHADTAGAGPAGHRIDVPYLDAEVAGDFARTLFARTEESTFRWT